MNAVCRTVKKNAVLSLPQGGVGPGKRRASGKGNPSTGRRSLPGGCDAACSRACKVGKKAGWLKPLFEVVLAGNEEPGHALGTYPVRKQGGAEFNIRSVMRLDAFCYL